MTRPITWMVYPAALRSLAAGLFAAVLAFSGSSSAATRVVPPGEGTLARAIGLSAPGDVLELRRGTYLGSVTVDRSLVLSGQEGAVVDGQGQGSVFTVSAPDVVIRGLAIVNSGTSLETEDSGIFADTNADGLLVENNRFENNLIGVFLKGPEDAVVQKNRVFGRSDLRMNERGNGIHLWNSPGSVVADNEVRYGRDGIFVTTSKRNVFRGNQLSDMRFGIHYMYTNASEVSGNVSRNNHVGFAIMFSDRLTVSGNRSEADRDHGIFLNFANGSTFENNLVQGGANKCIFIYNANKNQFRRNHFAECEIGIHFTGGSERNQLWENAFVGSRTQVKYVGSRDIEWSINGRGNYWSDNTAFDLDGDGIADQPYRPNDAVDQIVWQYPLAKLLLNSPAVQLLRWVQSEFPAILPGGVTDSAPLMAPVATEIEDQS